ncbi:di-heme oxidoredictase family protein [Rubripirellula reticaptiva]|uniref:di-heme oxidoredictase family protein n=1 Tax=Rubripirellula reticaptiva TaxID=2528013 RepID=UPI001FE3B792|nr:di-heme oxidoredictase family protein [Rubripirellula reticaptiva]
MQRRYSILAGTVWTLSMALLPVCDAASPISIEQGRQLFQKSWSPGNPAISSDGLGPLFNGQSCVACHNQGGVGGGGEAEFNAHTIGIEELSIVGGPVDDDVVKRMVSTFHPGFVLGDGTVINTLAMSHHGGSSAFSQGRADFLKQLPAEFSSHGGPVSASETRFATATPVLFHKEVGNYQMSLRARLYQRNTTALYGAGLINQVPESAIRLAAKKQEGHPEISGRPATLRSGKIGRFGWRANVASLVEFTDQACANEVGLETKRKPQPADPMMPGYRNSGIDISDEQIEAMRDFMAALPAPTRAIPSESKKRIEAERGEQLFASVGCAVCHLPSIGPANQIYSDLLLHDMGYELIDLNHAEPYIVRTTPQSRISLSSNERVTGTQMVGGYYGPASQISVDDVFSTSKTGDFSRSNRIRIGRPLKRGFNFVAPNVPEARMQLVDLDSKDTLTSNTFKQEAYDSNRGRVDNATVTREQLIRETLYVRVHFEPTNFNQEWRTPPLWGVRDSAPYMHDGRAETLLESISMHGGESAGTRDRFLQLSLSDRHAIIAFLNTLVAPPNAPQMAM